MGEVARISEQLRRAYEGEAWHGPSVREVIDGVTAEVAAARPLPAAHSIWEITLHILAWEDIARRRMQGETVNPTAEQDWPPTPEATPDAWEDTKRRLDHGHHALRAAIAALNDDALDTPVGNNRSSPYVLAHGVIQHDLYHAGQIAMLKKTAGKT